MNDEARTIEPPNDEPTTYRHIATGREVHLRTPVAIRGVENSPHWERVEDPRQDSGANSP